MAPRGAGSRARAFQHPPGVTRQSPRMVILCSNFGEPKYLSLLVVRKKRRGPRASVLWLVTPRAGVEDAWGESVWYVVPQSLLTGVSSRGRVCATCPARGIVSDQSWPRTPNLPLGMWSRDARRCCLCWPLALRTCGLRSSHQGPKERENIGLPRKKSGRAEGRPRGPADLGLLTLERPSTALHGGSRGAFSPGWGHPASPDVLATITVQGVTAWATPSCPVTCPWRSHDGAEA